MEVTLKPVHQSCPDCGPRAPRDYLTLKVFKHFVSSYFIIYRMGPFGPFELDTAALY